MFAVIGVILAFTAIMGLLFLPVNLAGALFLFGITLFLTLLFWATLPRHYLIYSDCMVIRLGGPFTFKAALQSIHSVKPAKPDDTISYAGLKFVTAFSGGVEIIRNNGRSLIITPEQPDAFIKHLDEALRFYSNKANGMHVH